MGRLSTCLAALLVAYSVLIGPFAEYMRQKPVVEKLGYVPRVEVFKAASADHQELSGALLVLKVLMYFGGLVEKQQSTILIPADYPAMSRMIHGAVKLDPYNMDAYYFAQAILVWDVGKVAMANELLDYGMRYRTWDWYLPFFAGFNHAYFLKNSERAAYYYEKAGALSGSDLFRKLAGRYLQESGRTDLAIAYLSSMEKGEKNPAVKKSYRMRIRAFQEVRRIEIALARYRKAKAKLPDSLKTLIEDGYLSPPPVDPYGGKFFFTQDGKVSSSSKFAVPSTRNSAAAPSQEN